MSCPENLRNSVSSKLNRIFNQFLSLKLHSKFGLFKLHLLPLQQFQSFLNAKDLFSNTVSFTTLVLYGRLFVLNACDNSIFIKKKKETRNL